MKKVIFFLLISANGWAACPLYTFPENHKLDQEFNNECDNILNPIINYAQISSATAKSVSISTLTFSDGTKMNTATSAGSTTGRLVQSSCTFRNDQTVTTSASFGDVTGITITLTPLSAASTLYINVAGGLFINGATVGELQLFNGSNVSIVPGAADNVFGEGNASGSANAYPVGFEMPYNYNSTSSLTVKLRMRSSDGVHNVIWNHNNAAEGLMCIKEFQ